MYHPYSQPDGIRYIVGVVAFGEYTVGTGCRGHGEGSGSESIIGFYVKQKYGKRPTIINSDFESVIGNIYEHKHLLDNK